jgi:hypothetical protein
VSYLRALATKLRAGGTPAPLVRPADAVAMAAEVEVERLEEPVTGLAAERAPPPVSEPGLPAAPPRPGHPPAATPPSPLPPPPTPSWPPPTTAPPSTAVPPSERVERQVVEHVHEVRHEHQTRTEVVTEQLVEPARPPVGDRRPQVVQPLIREIRYPPVAPAATPTVPAAAPDRVLPLPVVPERPPAEPAAPTVHVRIGRVIVRTDPPTPPPRPPPAPPAPRVGLADYLAGRESAPP